MSKLILGAVPGDLTLHLVRGDGFRVSLSLKEDGANKTWPEPPKLEFKTSAWEAEVDGATAYFEATEEEVEHVIDAESSVVRLSVMGNTWWSGTVISYG